MVSAGFFLSYFTANLFINGYDFGNVLSESSLSTYLDASFLISHVPKSSVGESIS